MEGHSTCCEKLKHHHVIWQSHKKQSFEIPRELKELSYTSLFSVYLKSTSSFVVLTSTITRKLLLLLVFVCSVDRLIRVGDVEEVVFFVVLLVERPHGGRGGRDHVVDEKEEGVLGPQRHTLADQEVELANRQVRRHQILLLVELGDPGLGRPLDDDGHAVRVLPPDLLTLRLPLLEGVLFLVLPLHLAGDVDLLELNSGLFLFSCNPGALDF